MGNPIDLLPTISWPWGVSTLIALVALLFSYRNYRLGRNRALAELKAAAEDANLSLVLYGGRLCGKANYERPLHFILDCPLEAGRRIYFPFIVELENLGLRTSSGVALFLRFPQILRNCDKQEMTSEVPISVTSDGPWEIVRFDLGDVNPGQKMVFEERICITDTAFEAEKSVGAFIFRFRVEQRDKPSVEGDISVGILGSSTEKPKALDELSRLLPSLDSIGARSLRDRFTDWFATITDRSFLEGQPMIVGRLVVRVMSDVRQFVKVGPIDRVSGRSLRAQPGVQDIRGKLWFPGVNAKQVFVFHGKSRPEIAGIEDHEVVNDAVHIATRYKSKLEK
jgi:hypothetical protein